MKALFKILLIGIIAGTTYRYLDEKGISLVDIASEIYEWISKKVESLEESAISDNTPNGNTGNDIRTAYDRWSSNTPAQESSYATESYSSNSEPFTIKLSSATDINQSNDFSDAVEYPVLLKTTKSTDHFSELDSYALNTPRSAESSIAGLVQHLTGQATNDIEKARLIYTWIATHIGYDDNGYNTGYYSDTSPEGVFTNRVSVCSGYSNLFAEMCRLAGLDAVKISGYSKGIGYREGDVLSRTDHAWNAVRVGNEWKLVDVTWGAGYGKGVNGRLVTVMQFDDYWFDTAPEEFIFAHLPEEEKWQMLDIPISKWQYENMPNVASPYFKMGFDGKKCLQELIDGTIKAVPKAYKSDGNIKILSLPYYRDISSEKAMVVKIKTDNTTKIALSNNGQWTYFEKDGSIFTAVVRPQRGELHLMANFEGDDLTYHTFLEYEVK